MEKPAFIDTEPVRKEYRKNNYIVEYSPDCPDRDSCALYFSSHNIYYPATYKVFEKRIVKQDFYEWRNNKMKNVYKHIFLRDVFRQWYLAGINYLVNAPEKLLEFLRKETDGRRIVAAGSSAGGFAAVLYGSLLGAERVFAFNAQFEINSLLKFSRESINPLVFRLQNSPVSKYFDVLNYIGKGTDIFYFYSEKSEWDIEQRDYIADGHAFPDIHKIGLSTSHHGVPVLKNSLERIFSMDRDELLALAENHPHSVFRFSVRLSGFWRTLPAFLVQTFRRVFRKIHRKLHDILVLPRPAA